MTSPKGTLLSISCAALMAMGATQARATDPYAPGEVVIKLNSAADLPGVMQTHQLTLIEQFGTRPIYHLRIKGTTLPPTKASTLASDSRVRYAEPNYLNYAPEVRRTNKTSPWAIGNTSAQYVGQWAPRAMRLPEAHLYSKGAGVRVAVLDTGIDDRHPAFAGRLIPGYDFVNNDALPREEGTRLNLGFGHGTHVAGLVALAAPAAKIMPVRVLDMEGRGNIWVLAEGLLYAVDPDRRPATNDGAQVINLSLGTTRRTALLEDIVRVATCEMENDDAVASPEDVTRCANWGGAVVVAAAGNSTDTTAHFPAAENVPGAMAVAASTINKTLATFTTRGDWVHAAAPGQSIISTVPGGGYGNWSGSSMAAPLVAGAAALLRTPTQTVNWPKPSDVVSKLASDGSTLCGSGLKQVDAAKILAGTSGPAVSCP